VPRGDALAAFRAGERGHGDLAAAFVDELDRRSGLARHPTIAPARERDDDRIEILALRGEPIFEARGALLVAHALEDAVRDQLPESVGEPMAGHAEVGLEALEASYAEERVAQHEQRPAVTDDGQRARHRARQIADLVPTHRPLISSILELS